MAAAWIGWGFETGKRFRPLLVVWLFDALGEGESGTPISIAWLIAKLSC